MSRETSNAQQSLLIQSIENLIRHLKRIQQPSSMQTQVMNNLSTDDIMKIIAQLDGNSQKIRKSSAQLLCYLLYKNQKNTSKLMQKLAISNNTGRVHSFFIVRLSQTHYLRFYHLTPLNSKVCLQNSVECLKLLKIPIRKTQLNKMCWIINPYHEKIFIQFLDEIELNAIPDLTTVLFGITYIGNSNNFLEVIQEVVKPASISTQKKFSIQRKQLRSRSKSINKKFKLRGYLNNGEHETSLQEAETAKSSSSIDMDIKFIKSSKMKDMPQQNNFQQSKLQNSIYQTLSYVHTSSTQDHYKNNPYFEKFVQNTQQQSAVQFKKQDPLSAKNHHSYVNYSDERRKKSVIDTIDSSYYSTVVSQQVEKISQMKYCKPKSYIHATIHNEHRNQSERIRNNVRVVNETRQNNLVKCSIAIKRNQPEQKFLYNHIKFREQRKPLP